MSDPIISVVLVSKTYCRGEEVVRALDGVSIDVARGEYVSIMGPSGSGKSTLFNMIGALDNPTSGAIRVAGHCLADLGAPRLAWVRCHMIGYVFQTFNLVPAMTALENVAIARVFWGRTPAEANKDAAEALASVGLADRMNHLPAQLSGGQQQRVAIARAIVNRPSVILADEPTGNLDLRTGEEIIALLSKMQRELGATIISATHDTKMLSASDRVVWIADGKIQRVRGRGDMNIETGSVSR